MKAAARSRPMWYSGDWRTIGRFALRFSIVYGFLILPWPGLSQGYATLFRAGCSVMMAPFSDWGRIRVQELSPASGWLDTEILLQARNTTPVTHLRLESRTFGYLPTAFLVALILAASSSRRSTFTMLAIGLLLQTAFIASRVGAAILVDGGAEPRGIVSMDRAWARIASSSELGFVVTTLIWILVSMRWARIPAGVARST